MTTRSSISVNAPARAKVAPRKLNPLSFRYAERASHGVTGIIQTSDGAGRPSLQGRGSPRLSLTARLVNAANGDPRRGEGERQVSAESVRKNDPQKLAEPAR